MPSHFFGRVHLSTYINFFVFFFSTSSVHRREQSLADRMTARNTQFITVAKQQEKEKSTPQLWSTKKKL
jgi:hypothetical protein